MRGLARYHRWSCTAICLHCLVSLLSLLQRHCLPSHPTKLSHLGLCCVPTVSRRVLALHRCDVVCMHMGMLLPAMRQDRVKPELDLYPLPRFFCYQGGGVPAPVHRRWFSPLSRMSARMNRSAALPAPPLVHRCPSSTPFPAPLPLLSRPATGACLRLSVPRWTSVSAAPCHSARPNRNLLATAQLACYPTASNHAMARALPFQATLLLSVRGSAPLR